ncbi:hypothetical protein BJX66DRAFT_342706 [Aspergillus keveii]|uniref:N-acetyltransferase domain-containing protein n=1 Tax=Aspergillus keveii TaxID=714993 RepID=A0ABR4FRB8_9EURO
MSFLMRKAKSADLDDVLSILHARVDWLRNRGNQQWTTSGSFRRRMTAFITNGHTWVLVDETQNETVATITAETEADARYWTETDKQTPALYISKMATAVHRRGERLGELLIAWSRDLAAQMGLEIVRWDAWRTNVRLHDWYRATGAKYVRMAGVENPGDDLWTELEASGSQIGDVMKISPSGALFEIQAGLVLDLQVRTILN